MQTTSCTIKLGGKPAVLPASDLPGHYFHIANTYYTEVGANPGHGMVLLQKQDLDTLLASPNHFHTLTFKQGGSSEEVSIEYIYISNYKKIHLGSKDSPHSLYGVFLTDIRHLFRHYGGGYDHAINIYSPVVQDNYHYADPTYSGQFSWPDVINRIWNNHWRPIANDLSLDHSNSLFYIEQAGMIDNLYLDGENLWDSFISLVDRFGAYFTYSHYLPHTSSAVFFLRRYSYISTDVQNKLDLLPVIKESPGPYYHEIIPESIEVYFPKYSEHRGSDHDLEHINPAFLDTQHKVTVATGHPSGAMGTKKVFRETKIARRSPNGQITNESELQTYASHIKDSLLAKYEYYRNPTLTVAGIVDNLSTGDNIFSICYQGSRPGTGCTTIINGSNPLVSSLNTPFHHNDKGALPTNSTPQIYASPTQSISSLEAKNYSEVQALKINSKLLNTQYDNLFRAEIVRESEGAYTTTEECLVLMLNKHWQWESDGVSASNTKYLDEIVLGKLCGYRDIGSARLPLFLVRDDRNDSIEWGITTTSTPSNFNSHTQIIYVHPCDTPIGDNENTSVTHAVYLLKHSDHVYSLSTGDPIGFIKDSQGFRYAVTPYLRPVDAPGGPP
ncbi:MAG: hypothetical protein MPJ24_08975 [Pirellulaceae bacterium]|nr:hypothetical protein [Pirellulaceae bacterium]